MHVKIGDKLVKIQGFNGPDEATVTKDNIDKFDGLVRAGLMKIAGSFRPSESKPKEENEDSGVLPVDNTTRKRSRKRSTESDGD